MEGNKCGNVLWYSYWRTHPHAGPYIEKKYIVRIVWCDELCVQGSMRRAVCVLLHATSCVCRAACDELCVQGYMRRAVYAGLHATSCVSRAACDELCMQGCMRRAVCAGLHVMRCVCRAACQNWVQRAIITYTYIFYNNIGIQQVPLFYVMRWTDPLW